MGVKEGMNDKPKARTLVVGLGEVGAALAAVLDRKETVLRHDLDRVKIEDPIGTMHICIPFQSPHQFETVALGYISRFQPALTIINSTVLPGTTRSIAEKSGSAVAYSPVFSISAPSSTRRSIANCRGSRISAPACAPW